MKNTLLDKINSPQDLKELPLELLPLLADEIREFIINTVSITGGHLAANLGFIEATIALHYVLDSPMDKIVWDVGHQAYTHKILTGRREQMHTLRKTNGISGFPNKIESEHDHFNVGHASTSISQALGLAVARDLKGDNEKIVAVCGDGALTGGLCYEGLNNAGHIKSPFVVILNDNKMAISRSTGAMSRYLNKIITTPIYNRIRSEMEKKLKRFPALSSFLKHIEESLKNLLVPGIVFEELGLRYFGPIDGHDINLLVETLNNVLKINEPVILHIVTTKGKGYEYAEVSSHAYHSAAPFNIATGEPLAAQPKKQDDIIARQSFSACFSDTIVRLAQDDENIVAITAAMPDGTGLNKFHTLFPKRFFDVGIAEEHAVSFAGALAYKGLKPICAIYSTFLQRSYDQLIHDVALQGANVTFCLDRAGVVGADGPTHHGLFDFAYMRTVPGSVVCAPANAHEMQCMLSLGIDYKGVFSMRYPKADIISYADMTDTSFKIGEAEVLKEGEDIMIIAIGSMVATAVEASESLHKKGIDVGVCNMRFVKPIDENVLLNIAQKYKKIITLEEHIACGGLGSAVLETLNKNKMNNIELYIKALPDYFVEQGARDYIFDKYGLSVEAIEKFVKEILR